MQPPINRIVSLILTLLLAAATGCEDRQPLGARPDGNTPPLDVPGIPGHPPMNGAGANGTGTSRDGLDPAKFQLAEIAGLAIILPSAWTRETVASPMRAAQFAIPGGAELVVFHFGPDQGGSASANMERWLSQLKDPRDVDRAEAERNGLKFSLVRGAGTWAPGAMGPNAPAPPPLENAGLIGIVIEGGPEGSVFIRITGPRDTVANLGEALDLLIRGTRRVDDPPPPQTAPANGGSPDGFRGINAAGVELLIPGGWRQEPPENQMRLAQFVLPGAAGQPDAEAVIYYFGANQGGSASDNLRRWLGQLSEPRDVQQDARSINGLTVSILRANGGFAPSPMPGMPAAAPIPDAGLVGVVIEGGPQGTIFIKITGPRQTVDAHRAAIDELIASARPTR